MPPGVASCAWTYVSKISKGNWKVWAIANQWQEEKLFCFLHFALGREVISKACQVGNCEMIVAVNLYLGHAKAKQMDLQPIEFRFNFHECRSNSVALSTLKGNPKVRKGVSHTLIHFPTCHIPDSAALGLPRLCWTFLPQVFSSQNTPSALQCPNYNKIQLAQQKTHKTNSKTNTNRLQELSLKQ